MNEFYRTRRRSITFKVYVRVGDNPASATESHDPDVIYLSN